MASLLNARGVSMGIPLGTRYHILVHNVFIINCCEARRDKIFEEYGNEAEEVGYIENAICPTHCKACDIRPCLNKE